MTQESFYIETDSGEYFCCSPTSGFYFTDDTSDFNIIDGSVLEIKYEEADTIRQISEVEQLGQGTQYDREDLFKHPTEECWLACEGRTVKTDSGTYKVFTPFWSRKFKLVSCISKSRRKCQGNAAWRKGSKSVKLANEKSRLAKKKRLANATETAKALNFDPMKRLALYAMGDKEGLGLKEDVKQATQMKALETYLKYSHQQLKPYSPQEVEKLQAGKDVPVVHVTLPSNDRELGHAVLSHDSPEKLDDYFSQFNEPDEYEAIEAEAGEFDEDTGDFVLPSNGREE